MAQFQYTPACAGDQRLTEGHEDVRSFNTRPRVRATRRSGMARRRRGVSIHARVCGRHMARPRNQHLEEFQYTPACAGDLMSATGWRSQCEFQYTPACAGDGCCPPCLRGPGGFNTRPRVRATVRVCRLFIPDIVSIHARVCGRRNYEPSNCRWASFNTRPRVRATPFARAFSISASMFQYTPACAGDSPRTSRRRCRVCFNTRPRVRATNLKISLNQDNRWFQYTPACAGDLVERAHDLPAISFNTRPRVRATWRGRRGAT